MCSLEDSFDTLSYQERDHHGITSGEQRYHDGVTKTNKNYIFMPKNLHMSEKIRTFAPEK